MELTPTVLISPIEKRAREIHQWLCAYPGNLADVAKQAGIGRSTIYEGLREWGAWNPRFKTLDALDKFIQASSGRRRR